MAQLDTDNGSELGRPHVSDPRERARFHLAYLMWCWSEGYLTKKDRAVGGGNWLLEDPSKLHPEDAVTRARLLVMADEILAALAKKPDQSQRLWMLGIYPVEVAPGKWIAMAVPPSELES